MHITIYIQINQWFSLGLYLNPEGPWPCSRSKKDCNALTHNSGWLCHVSRIISNTPCTPILTRHLNTTRDNFFYITQLKIFPEYSSKIFSIEQVYPHPQIQFILWVFQSLTFDSPCCFLFLASSSVSSSSGSSSEDLTKQVLNIDISHSWFCGTQVLHMRENCKIWNKLSVRYCHHVE